jgi:hypothetical protein
MKHILQTTAVVCCVNLTACGSKGGPPTTPNGPSPSQPRRSSVVTQAWCQTPSPARPSVAQRYPWGQQPSTTAGDGTWALNGTGNAATRQALTITAPGYGS